MDIFSLQYCLLNVYSKTLSVTAKCHHFLCTKSNMQKFKIQKLIFSKKQVLKNDLLLGLKQFLNVSACSKPSFMFSIYNIQNCAIIFLNDTKPIS